MECRLTDDWENTENIIIYGFGKVAHDNLDFFKNNFNILPPINNMKRGAKFVLFLYYYS